MVRLQQVRSMTTLSMGILLQSNTSTELELTTLRIFQLSVIVLLTIEQPVVMELCVTIPMTLL